MSDFDAFEAPFTAVREQKTYDLGGDWFGRSSTGWENHAGQPVNWRTALEVTTVLACVRVLAEGVAQMPAYVMRKRAGGIGADKATDSPLYDIFSRKPNSWQTSFEFRETIMIHLAMMNNHFSLKNRVRGQVAELIPMEPQRVDVTRNRDLSLRYDYTTDDGNIVHLTQDDVWHVRGPSWNSWMGLEAINLAREAVGLAMSLEKTSGTFQKNAARPSGIYSIEGNLTKEQHEKLSAEITKKAKSASGEPFILDRGAKWVSQALSGVDMQHLESRKFQIEEICRGFRVMPIMVGASDKTATYASAEQMFLAHVIHTLMPWVTRIEESADVNLLGAGNDTDLYLHLDAKGLMRGAAKDRGDYFAKALGSGGSPAWMTQDEIRDEEDLNPMGGTASDLPAGGHMTDAVSVPAEPAEPVTP